MIFKRERFRHFAFQGVLYLLAGCISSVIALPVTPFPLSQVRLLNGPFRTAMQTNRMTLDVMGVERALYAYRYQAGLSTNGAQPFTSWATPEPNGAFPGFYEGHYLSAIALSYAQTGDTALLNRVNYMVAELGKCQTAMGGQYLFASPQVEFDANRLDGVPWYRMHKLLEGLLAAYNCAGNAQALAIAANLAAWIKTRQDIYTANNQWTTVKGVEPGGIQEALENLYIATGNAQHRTLSRQWEERSAILDPLYNGQDVVGGHANTYLAKMVGAAKTAEFEKDSYYLTATQNFWNFVAGSGGRCYATGGTSVHESFPGANAIANTQARFAQETCCSYNLAKICRSLYLATGDLKYMEWFERLLYNAILGCQDSVTGWKTYYQPLNANTVKDFRSYTTGCYCCNGTGLESPSKFGETVYAHDSTAVYVNLFIASTVSWPQKNFSLEQATAFPEEQGTRLTVHVTAPVTLTVAIRVPGWCTSGFVVTVNGATQSVSATPLTYASINRTWNEGDVIAVTLPIRFSRSPMPNLATQMAFLYGPVVMVGVGGRPYMSELIGNTGSGTSWVNNLGTWFQPVTGQPLTFTGTDAANRVVTFKPYYQMVTDQFFTAYWDVVPTATVQNDSNIALGKATSESDPQPPGVNVACFQRSARAVDGYYTGNDAWYLRWESDGALPQWWKVDLGALYRVTRTSWYYYQDANWPRYFKYRIEYSTNNTTWTIFADKSNNTAAGNPYTDNSTGVNARYLRVTLLTATGAGGPQNNGWPANINEFKAWGTPVVAVQPAVVKKNTQQFVLSVRGMGAILSLENVKVERIDIFSLQGKLVRTIPVASQKIVWDRKNNAGELLNSGAYMVKVAAKGKNVYKNIILFKK